MKYQAKKRRNSKWFFLYTQHSFIRMYNPNSDSVQSQVMMETICVNIPPSCSQNVGFRSNVDAKEAIVRFQSSPFQVMCAWIGFQSSRLFRQNHTNNHRPHPSSQQQQKKRLPNIHS
jgi:hypothetical protein